MKFKFSKRGFYGVLFFSAAFILTTAAHGEYADQLRAQVKRAESEYGSGREAAYFRNMGIIARKADDSQNYELLGEIIRSALFEKMESSIDSQIKLINEQLEQDPALAVSTIKALQTFQSYYKPSADFLESAAGVLLAGEMASQRQSALEALKSNLSKESFLKALNAYHKTGLFLIRKKQEEEDLNHLRRQIGCSMGWKQKLIYKSEAPFKTDYEEGIAFEEAELALQTSASDYAVARWKGPWIYRYTGRKGVGQGVSEAVIELKRGEYYTEVFITAAQLSSKGSFNFPFVLEPVKKLIDIKPPQILPRAEFGGQTFSLTGCPDDTSKIPAKVETKTGRVLLG